MTPATASPSESDKSSEPPLPAVEEGAGHEGSAEYIELPRFSELDPDTAYPITAASPTRVLVVAGLADSGKTTLVASIYECFLKRRSFAGYCFAGSETLLGFEKRCHLARTASGLSRADTERTGRSEGTPLLHLRVRPEGRKSPGRDLLFTDVFGEAFREAKDSSDACRRLGILRRADRLLLLVDGGELSQNERRFAAYSAVRDFLRRSLDTGMLPLDPLVDVLATKWDIVDRLPPREKASAEEYIRRIEALLTEDFVGRVDNLRFGRIAARPSPESALALCHGVEPLFSAWVEESSLYRQPGGHEALPRFEREIDRYLNRRGISRSGSR